MSSREETDSMGTVMVPGGAYYGAQTGRAIDNFFVSGRRMPIELIRGLALIKRHAALVNANLGLVDKDLAAAIEKSAAEVMEGRHDEQFPVDVFQTGSGTSTNMNMNEVLATRANEMLTGERQTKGPVHPNDHVNCGQSSNDVMPSALHLAAMQQLRQGLIPALCDLHSALEEKAVAFRNIRKIGRTHLQDAVIMTLGDEFSGYAAQMNLALERVNACQPRLCRMALGGTAVGNGLNAHPDFAGRVVAALEAATDIPFVEAPNHFEAQGACDAAVETSGVMKTIAVGMMKIANDIRWLASGPRCGLGEINLPALQPGSSIMPGKVNPVIPEAVIQASAQVIGNDAAITAGGLGGVFELNTMLPMVGDNLLQSIVLLGNAAVALTDKCVTGITANAAVCTGNIEKSLAIVTNMVPYIGYDRAADIAGQAYAEGRTIEAVALENNIMPPEELKRVLYGGRNDPWLLNKT
ncbi:MAG: class II fumarate hydratase [Thermodesulfobacteriota bacterium]|nr:class II fumarate hydratase [Thermodesulfobacteriota bacterium]